MGVAGAGCRKRSNELGLSPTSALQCYDEGAASIQHAPQPAGGPPGGPPQSGIVMHSGSVQLQ